MRMSKAVHVGAIQGAGVLLGIVAGEAARTHGWTIATPHSVSALLSISVLLAISVGVIATVVSVGAFLVLSRGAPWNATVLRLRRGFGLALILGAAIVP